MENHEDLRARVDVVEAKVEIVTRDISGMKDKLDEQALMNAERGEALRHITSTLGEMKGTLGANTMALQSLTTSAGVTKHKVAWLIAGLLFVANIIGQGAGDAIRGIVAVGRASPPAVTSTQK